MKNKLYVICAIILLSINLRAQAIKTSSFMILPANDWMTQHGYATKENNQGQTVYLYDYDRAFNEDPDLKSVIKMLAGAMKDRGIQKIIDYEGNNKSNSMMNKYNTLTTKATVKTSSVDKILQDAKLDVLINIYWTVVKTGPKTGIDNFRIDAVDGFSGQDINSFRGNGILSYETRQSILLEEALNNGIDPFLAKIETHIEDVFAKGRKATIIFDIDESWDGDFDKEFNGKELKEIIENWLSEHTVNGSFELATNSGENNLIYDARIPLYDENQKGINAESFIKPLSKMLNQPPYNTLNKTTEFGLGLAKVTMGAKKK